MINKTLEFLFKKGVEKVVNTSNALERKMVIPSEIEWYFVKDVRSAVFNAYGMSKISHKPVVVVVEDDFLPNTLTALTEAWFQRVSVVILTVNSNELANSSYLDRCVDAKYLIIDADDIKKIVLQCGPILIKVKENVCTENKIDYAHIVPVIENCAKDSIVFCYNPTDCKSGYEIIKTQYKYGVLSKYVGQLVGGKKALLCIPEELLALDTNIFNFRDFPQGFRLIVKHTDGFYWNKLKKWMQKNNIKTVEVDSMTVNFDTLEINSNYAILVK